MGNNFTAKDEMMLHINFILKIKQYSYRKFTFDYCFLLFTNQDTFEPINLSGSAKARTAQVSLPYTRTAFVLFSSGR